MHPRVGPTDEGRPQRVTRRRWRRALVPGWSLILALVALGPALGPGYLLSYDLVATPRQFLVPEAWGLGDGFPRAVPYDAVVAVVTAGVDGALVQKTLLLAAVTLAGWGAGALLRPLGTGTAVVAATAAAWNPWVAERLVLGQLPLLLGYGLLPWVVRAALRVRATRPRAGAQLGLLLLASALAPTSGLVASTVALLVLLAPGAGRRPAGVALGLVVWPNLAWLVPALVADAGPPDPAGAAAFAARAESPLGVVPSLLGGGGVWNAEVVPAERTSAVVVAVTAAVAVVGYLAGRGPLRAVLGPGAVGLELVGLAGLATAAVLAVPAVAEVLGAATTHVPALGLLRDGHKLLAPWVLLVAACLGAATHRIGQRVTDQDLRRALPVLAVAVVLVPLPGLAWGAGAALVPARYPAQWAEVAQGLHDDPRPGDVVSLPWGSFRAFEWNRSRTALDPLPRYLDRTVVRSDDLLVGQTLIGGEAPRAAATAAALSSDDPVAALLDVGIGWVTVSGRTPGHVPGWLAALPVVAGGADLRLHRLPDGPAEVPTRPWRVAAVVAGFAAVAAGAVTCVVGCVAPVSAGRRATHW